MSLIVQRAEYALRTAKMLGVKDRSAFTSIDPKVVPVIIVGDSRDSFNSLQERHCITWENITSGAAQFAAVELQNPAGSGLTVVVDRVMVMSTTAVVANVAYRITGAAALTGAPTKAAQYIDPIQGTPIARARSESLAAFTEGAARLQVPVGGMVDIALGWVIQASDTNLALRFTNILAGVNNLQVTFLYRELYPGDPIT